MLTPGDVYYGNAEEVLARRQAALDGAYTAHPERFPNGPPTVKALPPAVFVNPPADLQSGSETEAQQIEPPSVSRSLTGSAAPPALQGLR
jgi:putative transposase